MNKITKTCLQLFTAIVLVISSPLTVAGPKGPTIVDVTVEANAPGGAFEGLFDTLIAAVLAAGPEVIDTLTGNGQHTVFAPTDDAFAILDLNPGNVGNLDQDVLTEILKYHVANGRRYSSDIIASDQIRMINGGFVQQAGGVLTDNNGGMSSIIVTDVPAANGVIHAIDAVLIP